MSWPEFKKNNNKKNSHEWHWMYNYMEVKNIGSLKANEDDNDWENKERKFNKIQGIHL